MLQEVNILHHSENMHSINTFVAKLQKELLVFSSVLFRSHFLTIFSHLKLLLACFSSLPAATVVQKQTACMFSSPNL
jgi:hypothetical protein